MTRSMGRMLMRSAVRAARNEARRVAESGLRRAGVSEPDLGVLDDPEELRRRLGVAAEKTLTRVVPAVLPGAVPGAVREGAGRVLGETARLFVEDMGRTRRKTCRKRNER